MSIYRNIKKEKVQQDTPVGDTVVGYTISAKSKYKDQDGNYILSLPELEAANHPYVYAFQSVANGLYYVKVGQDGKLFNPYGLFTEGTERLERMGRPVYSMKPISNKNVFDKYVNFLRTKNEGYLRNAERELV